MHKKKRRRKKEKNNFTEFRVQGNMYKQFWIIMLWIPTRKR